MNIESPIGFSVVITSYNYRAFVSDAVDSALAQSHAPREVIIVDDGSTDGSVDLLTARYGDDARVRLILKPNGGQLSAFKAGVEAAHSEVIAFLDADDLWEPDHLAGIAAAYKAPGGADYVFTNLSLFGSRGGTWHDRIADHVHGMTALLTYQHQAWIGSPTSGLTMRRRLALQLLEMPAWLIAEWRVRADDVLVYGASLFGARTRYVASPSARYRVHDHNQWLDRACTPMDLMAHKYRVDRLFGHVLTRAGLTVQSLRLVRLEFETRPAPTPGEFRQYRKLAWKAPVHFGKRLELVIGIIQHYRKTRRHADS